MEGSEVDTAAAMLLELTEHLAREVREGRLRYAARTVRVTPEPHEQTARFRGLLDEIARTRPTNRDSRHRYKRTP